VTKKRDQKGIAEEEQAEPQAVEKEEKTPTTGDQPELETTEEDQVLDELTKLRQELEEAHAQEAEYLDGWQRARAELANARKRFQREQEQAYTNAKAGIFAYLLPVIEDFERAFDTVPEEVADLPWLEGMRLVQRKFQRLLEQEGVETIEATGQEFDPFFHEAVTHEPSETVAAGHVIGELQRGYKMGDRVLRPSMVRVSAGSLPTDSGPSDETTTTDDE